MERVELSFKHCSSRKTTPEYFTCVIIFISMSSEIPSNRRVSSLSLFKGNSLDQFVSSSDASSGSIHSFIARLADTPSPHRPHPSIHHPFIHHPSTFHPLPASLPPVCSGAVLLAAVLTQPGHHFLHSSVSSSHSGVLCLDLILLGQSGLPSSTGAHKLILQP